MADTHAAPMTWARMRSSGRRPALPIGPMSSAAHYEAPRLLATTPEALSAGLDDQTRFAAHMAKR